MSSIIYLGMDVHKETFNLCAYDLTSKTILRECQCKAEAKKVCKFVNSLKDEYGDDIHVKAGYEAGCLGYSLYRSLNAMGIECVILAPTTMQKSVKNKINKNDRNDASNIATCMDNPLTSYVNVPDQEDEEIKEYIRMVNNFKKEFKTIKQQIKAFLLRAGIRYPGKGCWAIGYMKWLRNLELRPVLRETLNEMTVNYYYLDEKIECFADRIEEFYHSERYEEQISKLRCFSGIDTLSAMTIQVEISDFSRFPKAKAFSAYIGLTEGEHSSGEKNNHTGISKAGNKLVRSTLIECARSLVKTNIYQKSKKIKSKQKGQSTEVVAYADKATKRLVKKYNRLKARNVPGNKAIVAVARELACFIWGMENDFIHQ